jgi:hypothetical protein
MRLAKQIPVRANFSLQLGCGVAASELDRATSATE